MNIKIRIWMMSCGIIVNVIIVFDVTGTLLLLSSNIPDSNSVLIVLVMVGVLMRPKLTVKAE